MTHLDGGVSFISSHLICPGDVQKSRRGGFPLGPPKKGLMWCDADDWFLSTSDSKSNSRFLWSPAALRQLPKYWSSVQIWGICTLHEYLYIFHYICWLITGPICKKVDFWVSFPMRQWYWCFGIVGRFGSRPKASAFDVFGTFLHIGAFPFHKATSSFINYLKKPLGSAVSETVPSKWMKKLMFWS